MGTPRSGLDRSAKETTQAANGPVDHPERMSVIHAQRPLATGIDTAVLALKKAQDRLGVAASDIARAGATTSESTTKEGVRIKPPTQTPPNPGPPGGAVPGDLAQVMMEQNNPTRPREVDLAEAVVSSQLASHEIAANVKTVQAFDAMLEELTRLKQPQKPGKTE
jgi:hypothetical protein